MPQPIPNHPMTRAEFARWSVAYEGPKCELVGGRIVQQSRTTKRHSEIVMNIAAALRARLDLDVWAIMAETVAVEPLDRTRLPDLLVERRDAPGPPLVATDPVLLVEVLSPSSPDTDFIEKPAEYVTLPTLATYLVVSQEAAICWAWQRGADGTFPKLPVRHEGLDARVPLPAFATTLPLADIYARIGVT
jgi:Uma2 family endonuclease